MNCIVERKSLTSAKFTYTITVKEWTSEEIKASREKLDLYQREFAELLVVKRKYVNYLEKGVKKPSKMLCLLLDCIDEKKKEEKGGLK